MDRFRQKELLRLAPGEFGIAQFALQVVAIIVGDTATHNPPVRDDVLNLVVRGALTGDPLVFEKLLSEMRRLHISAEAMVDDYIPAAAREIGEQWHEDIIDILDATVATSRLQNLLRELGRAWSADAFDPRLSASVLMVVPETEQHTLGAMIATAQMRRRGISVAVQLLSSRKTLLETLDRQNFDAVFFFVSTFEGVESCRNLVAAARGVLPKTARIAVGGPVTLETDDLRRMTGADLASRDVVEALREFGLLKTATAAI